MNPRYEGASPAATYNGFSGPTSGPQLRRGSPYLSRKAILSGVALALVGGLAIGALSRPEIAHSTPRPMSPVAVASLGGSAQPLPIVMSAPPAPPPVERAAGGEKLEVLPADMAAATPVGYRQARAAPPRLETASAVQGYDAADAAPVRIEAPRRQAPAYAGPRYADRYAEDRDLDTRYGDGRYRDERYSGDRYADDPRADRYADEDDGPYGDPRD